MIVIHKIKIDMQASAVPEVVNVVQLDSNTRVIQAALYSGNVPFEIGNNASVSLACFKPDRTKCWYDELPNGNPAASVEGNTVSITLAPEVLTVAGSVNAAIVIREGLTNQISTFPFWICVARNPAAGSIISNNYYKVSDLESLNSWMKDVLCCTPQEWTAEQQAQARQNIGAMAAGIQKSLAINSTDDTAADVVLETELRESGTAAMQFYSGGADVGAEHHTILGGLADGENDTDAATVGQVKEMVSQSSGGTVKTVNGISPDENGNVEVDTGSGDEQPKIKGTAIEETCIKFTSLLCGTDKAESFLFFADPHLGTLVQNYEGLTHRYINAAKAYYDATPTSFALNGGDTIHENATAEEMCHRLAFVDGYMRKNFDRYYPTVGNHDDNWNGVYDNPEAFSQATIRNLMLRGENGLYYSFDGVYSKGYVLNATDNNNARTSQDRQMTEYRWNQIDWLANRLKADDADNSFLLYHQGFTRIGAFGSTNPNDYVLSAFSIEILKLCEAYNKGTTITLNGNEYNFAGCKGCVRFILSGHIHFDKVEISNGIPVIASYDLRKWGTTPTFDLCLADFDNNVLKMVRVGAGNSRDVYLPSKDFEGNFYTVTTNFTDITASNNAVLVREGDPYETVLIAPIGFAPSSVVVTMNGVDITSTAYSNGQITIESITGNIEISANKESVDFVVVMNLTGVAASNTATTTPGGARYENTLTAIAADKYLAGVTVFMDGVDITSTTHKNGVITIESVTGDIEITANVIGYNNLADPTSDDWIEDVKFNTTNKTFDSDANKNGQVAVATNYIPLECGTAEDLSDAPILRFKGFDRTNKMNGGIDALILYYDADKNYLQRQTIMLTSYTPNLQLPESNGGTEDENGITTYKPIHYKLTDKLWTEISSKTKYIRINALLTGSEDDAVITINQPIE